MSVTYASILARKSPNAKRSKRVRCLVDTGAHLTVLPAELLRELGVRPRETEGFDLADGSTFERKTGDVFVEFRGRGAYTRAVFGEDDDATLLGMMTLEELHLWIDPIRRQLHPMRLQLVSMGRS